MPMGLRITVLHLEKINIVFIGSEPVRRTNEQRKGASQ